MSDILGINAKDIPDVKLTETQDKICELIVKIAMFFFRGYGSDTVPFRGFLLEGPPGNGKTEIARQASRRLALRGIPIRMSFIDSAKIARPEWGKAEEFLSTCFIPDNERKTILLFDDIECLFIKRGAEVAKEWHYSLNALLLHKLDTIDPTKMLVVATTNRPSLIDYALRSRLYSIKVPKLHIKELEEVAMRLLDKSWPVSSTGDTKKKEEILKLIIEDLSKKKYPSIRDVQHLTIVHYIEKGVWSHIVPL
ncbi:MAG: ATP-binding protein [Nitrososphaeria archaeon]